jgi:SAM-dependent methyltransferase
MAFLVDYNDTPFLKTNRTFHDVNRLNRRCEMLLSRNLDSIRGKKILDIASHDGTFSYACLRLGAKHVTGVEPRSHLVKDAVRNLTSLGYKNADFAFIVDDVFNYLPKVETGQFDTILCFGFLYHTTRQTELLSQINRIRPAYFILDCRVETFEIPQSQLRGFQRWECRETAGYLAFYYENTSRDVATFHHTGLSATPTRSLLEALLKDYGFSFKQLSWSTENKDKWREIYDQESVAYLAEIKPDNPPSNF